MLLPHPLWQGGAPLPAVVPAARPIWPPLSHNTVRKRGSQPPVVAAAGNISNCNTLAVSDRRSGRSYLVDTGANVSVFPASFSDRKSRPNSASLVAANGSTIRTWGQHSVPLHLGRGRLFTQEFHIADVARPILGTDFFRQNNLAIDLAGQRLIDLTHNSTVLALPDASLPLIAGLSPTATNQFSAILAEFPNLMVPRFNPDVNKHGVEHHILTTGHPVFSKARRLDPEKLAVAEAEFPTMEDLGIIRLSKFPWASPLHVAPKPSDGWRPCGDYRRLNQATEDDRYPLPHIQDFNVNLAGAKIFSKVDPMRGQIPMAPDSIPKTAIITLFSLYEFLCMPFGLKNAAQAFQRLMDSILCGLPFVFVYVDDILVASSSASKHKNHLRQVFCHVEANGLVVRKDKCLFGVSEVDFLGHRVTQEGILPIPEHVSVIREYPVPDSRAALQRFLGMINYYHRFCPKIAGHLHDEAKTSSGQMTARRRSRWPKLPSQTQHYSTTRGPMHQRASPPTLRVLQSAARWSSCTVACGAHCILLQEVLNRGGQVRRLRPGAAGHLLRDQALPTLP